MAEQQIEGDWVPDLIVFPWLVTEIETNFSVD